MEVEDSVGWLDNDGCSQYGPHLFYFLSTGRDMQLMVRSQLGKENLDRASCTNGATQALIDRRLGVSTSLHQ